MEAYQVRVVDELMQFTIKREALALFIGQSLLFSKLLEDEQYRLRKQFDIMVAYEGVLQERIDHFPEQGSVLATKFSTRGEE